MDILDSRATGHSCHPPSVTVTRNKYIINPKSLHALHPYTLCMQQAAQPHKLEYIGNRNSYAFL